MKELDLTAHEQFLMIETETQEEAEEIKKILKENFNNRKNFFCDSHRYPNITFWISNPKYFQNEGQIGSGDRSSYRETYTGKAKFISGHEFMAEYINNLSDIIQDLEDRISRMEQKESLKL